MSEKSRKKGRRRPSGGTKPADPAPAVDETSPAVAEDASQGVDEDGANGADTVDATDGNGEARSGAGETRADPTAIDATAIDPALLELDPDAPPPDSPEVRRSRRPTFNAESAWLEAAAKKASEPPPEEPPSGPESGESDAGEPASGEPESGEPESGESDAGEISLGETVGSAIEPAGPMQMEFDAFDAAMSGRDSLDITGDEDDGDAFGEGEPVSGDFLKGLLEALVFASDRPLKPQELARLASASLKDVKLWLRAIREDFVPRGLKLDEVAEGFVFRTDPKYAHYVRDMTKAKPIKLSRAQIETLAILAYRQPITRPEIDEIRGVDCGPVLKMLLDRDLIRILGKKDEPGRPLLYGTTPAFLEFFGLKSLKDLPTLHEFTELNDESRKVVERELGEVIPPSIAETVQRTSEADAPEVQPERQPEPAREASAEGANAETETGAESANAEDANADAEEQIVFPLDDDEDPAFGVADDSLPQASGRAEPHGDPTPEENDDLDEPDPDEDDPDHSSSAGSE